MCHKSSRRPQHEVFSVPFNSGKTSTFNATEGTRGW
jgi:hypothetical protein